MQRERLLRAVDRCLGPRRLVWSGLRADDACGLTDLPQMDSSYSILAASPHQSEWDGLAYETLSGTRVDLEAWDIQDHLRSDAGTSFRRALLDRLSKPSALVAYRPSQFLSAVHFARQATCLNLGLFGGHQAAFEHKPWIETSLASIGIPRVPWVYIADEDQERARVMVQERPVMLRRSRTSGGAGLVRVDDVTQLVAAWPRAEESFVSVAPYLEGALPVNIGATAWEGGVTIQHPSVQLVGLPSCVVRPFGYCGNDFGLARNIDLAVLNQIEHRVVAIGDWLRQHGYRGTFGVDFLVHDGQALFMEVNPRFQGSSHSSALLAREAGEGCLFLEHVAARLGLDAPPARSLREITSMVTPLAHVVVHWTGNESRSIDSRGFVDSALRHDASALVDVVVQPSLVTDPGGVVGRVTVRGALTTTGFDLDKEWLAVIDDWHAAQRPFSPLAVEHDEKTADRDRPR